MNRKNNLDNIYGSQIMNVQDVVIGREKMLDFIIQQENIPDPHKTDARNMLDRFVKQHRIVGKGTQTVAAAIAFYHIKKYRYESRTNFCGKYGATQQHVKEFISVT